uniref:C-type lectin domain-containing protein n=1 Tax=Panagrolaimus sp. PS1159 TaxID=55785 RepID=A0AC35F8F0_9BILA
MFENFFLIEIQKNTFTSDDFWFGANSLSTTGNWSWMDNTPFDFSDWEKGQPQNFTNCGIIRIQDAKWLSDDCFKSKPYICKIVDMPSKVCTPSWTLYSYTGFCYKVFANATWQDAENKCLADSGHLASIHSFEEAEFVADLAYWPGADVLDGLKQAWIGLYTEDNNTHWQWTDGTPFDYPNWDPGNPDYPGIENCVEIFLESYITNWKAGQFNNFPCSDVVSKFVCKKSPQ